MTTETLTVDTSGNVAKLTAGRGKLHTLRNAIFAAYWDGRFDNEEGKELRAAIPAPNETMTRATFELDRERLTAVAEALKEAAKVHKSEGREATADGLDNISARFHFNTGKLPADTVTA